MEKDEIARKKRRRSGVSEEELIKRRGHYVAVLARLQNSIKSCMIKFTFSEDGTTNPQGPFRILCKAEGTAKREGVRDRGCEWKEDIEKNCFDATYYLLDMCCEKRVEGKRVKREWEA